MTPYNGGTWVVPGSHKDPRTENQHKAARARFVDQPALREPGRIGDNSHVVAGAMSVEEWEQGRAKSKR